MHLYFSLTIFAFIYSPESGFCVECYGVSDNAHIIGGCQHHNNWGIFFCLPLYIHFTRFIFFQLGLCFMLLAWDAKRKWTKKLLFQIRNLGVVLLAFGKNLYYMERLCLNYTNIPFWSLLFWHVLAFKTMDLVLSGLYHNWCSIFRCYCHLFKSLNWLPFSLVPCASFQMWWEWIG